MGAASPRWVRTALQRLARSGDRHDRYLAGHWAAPGAVARKREPLVVRAISSQPEHQLKAVPRLLKTSPSGLGLRPAVAVGRRRGRKPEIADQLPPMPLLGRQDGLHPGYVLAHCLVVDRGPLWGGRTGEVQ
jgi:hypothetical protein